jgi:hypothetical protein
MKQSIHSVEPLSSHEPIPTLLYEIQTPQMPPGYASSCQLLLFPRRRYML